MLKIFDISNIERIKFRADINGLRALAVLSVVFYHAEINLFKGGWLGVDIFFVVSGYLISNIIISELNANKFSFKSFYYRRAKRILPALVSTILITIPISYLLLTPKAMTEYLNSIFASLFFYANYHFMNLDFYVAESTKFMPFLHTWSLAIEEQYYLIFPIFTYIIYKISKNYLTFFIGVFISISIYLNSLTQSFDKFYRLEFRIWELLIGALIMIIFNSKKLKHSEILALPMIVFSLFYFDDTFINHIEPKLLSLTGVCLLLASKENLVLDKLSNIKVISLIGLGSYSIYLLHQPIFAFSKIYLLNIKAFEINIFSTTVLIFFTLIAGYLHYLVVEQRIFSNFLILKLTTAIITIIIFSYIGLNTDGFTSRYINSNQLNQTTALEDRNADNLIQNTNEYKVDQNTFNSDLDFITLTNKAVEYQKYGQFDLYMDGVKCHKNFKQENMEIFCNNKPVEPVGKQIFIIGDSSARLVIPSIYKSFEDYDVTFITGGGCIYLIDEIKNEYCSIEDEIYHESIQEIKNSIIVYFAHLHNKFNSKNYSDLIPNTIEYLAKNNFVIVVKQIPVFEIDIPDYILNNNNNPNGLSFNQINWYSDNTFKEIEKMYDKINNPNVFFIESSQLFCNSFVKDSCIGALKDKLYFFDTHHLTVEGGEVLTNAIYKLVKELD